MEKTKFVFVILVYRNYKDLEECIQSIQEKVSSFKIIVVNAFFDEESHDNIKSICDKNNCSFIEIENKGYSYGNNRGIEIANSNFDYEYLIVSNPDIVIKEFDETHLEGLDKCSIIASKITAADGRAQNPLSSKRSKTSEDLTYKGLVKGKKLLFMLGIAINKLHRNWFLLFSKKKIKTVYAAHGSFVIMSKAAIEGLNSHPYDENMFLFAEESVLAEKARQLNIPTYYFPYFSIYHKEDGSMKLAEISVNKELIKSNIYFYENYVLKDKTKKQNKNAK